LKSGSIAGLAAGLLVLAHVSHAADIRVMASAAIKEAYLELVPQFERSSGHKVITEWVPTVDLLSRIKSGETVDLVIMVSTSIDDLINLGKLAAGSRVDLVKSGVGVAVRAGAPRPDISSAESLKRALRAAKSISYSTGPSGVYLVDLFQRMGLTEELRLKIKQVKGIPVGAVVARGDAEIGFQQVSELLPVPGIDFIGPLPAEIQQTSVFAAGVHAAAKEPDAARALIKFITSPAAAPVIRKRGLEPA
jgi:molybdate transport system substrate-binding protein